MPEAMHRALKAQAKKKGFTGERANRYIYGTMAKHEAMKRRLSRGSNS